MQVTRYLSRVQIVLCAAALASGLMMFSTGRNAVTAGEEKLDRAQTIIANLNKVQGCAGWYILQDINKLKEMDHDLGKARFQIEEADHTYARLRGRKDDHFLTAVKVKVEKAESERKQLEDDLHDAFDQLRETIKDVLLMDQKKAK